MEQMPGERIPTALVKINIKKAEAIFNERGRHAFKLAAKALNNEKVASLRNPTQRAQMNRKIHYNRDATLPQPPSSLPDVQYTAGMMFEQSKKIHEVQET